MRFLPRRLGIAALLAALPLAAACAPPKPSGKSSNDQALPGAAGKADPADAPKGEAIQTAWGPLNAADRDLLAKVRLAGLWEIPTGRQASQRAARAKTRQNLGSISQQHVQLDAITRRVATRLRVPLPDEPNADQKKWMAEISSKSGVEYDKTAVLRLRQAHGKVYPVLAAVRGSTNNTLIRDFAKTCEQFVHRHMVLLEGTGLVNGAALPEAPPVTGAPKAIPPGEGLPVEPPATNLPSSDNN